MLLWDCYTVSGHSTMNLESENFYAQHSLLNAFMVAFNNRNIDKELLLNLYLLIARSRICRL